MRKKGIYLVSVAVLVCLVISAFLAPGMAMKAYDHKALKDYEFQFRPGIDYKAVNTTYEMDREARLNAFSKGIGENRQYFITASGEEPQNWDELLINTFEQEIAYLLWELGILWRLDEMYDFNNLTNWEHYMVYDTDGAVFLCWYLEVTTKQQTVRLLVDSKDYTIYYLECYQPDIYNIYLANRADKEALSELSGYNLAFLTLIKQYYNYESDVNAQKWYEKNSGVNVLENYENSAEIINFVDDIEFGQGVLNLNARFLNRYNGYYGFGIGIGQLWELLPEEKKGTLLESFG